MKKKRNVVCVVSCLLVVLILTSVLAGCVGKTSVDESAGSETSAVGMPTVNGENLKELQPVDMPIISTDLQIRNLEKLCRVWGYVKYTHSVFLLGQRDWDEELLKLMPVVSSAESEDKVNDILYDWFMSLGENDYDTLNRMPGWLAAKEEDKIVQTDLSWRANEDYLGKPLSEALSQQQVILNVNRQNAPVSFDQWGRSTFSNENSYVTMDYADSRYRLLGLFRMWNAVAYYSPYLDILDDDWNKMLPIYIPKMLDNRDKQSYELTLAELSTKLHDAHVFFRGRSFTAIEFGRFTVPVKLIKAEGRLVVLEANEEGCPLMPGDVLMKVDGKDIEEVIEHRKKYLSANTDDKLLNTISPYLLNSKDDTLDVTVLRYDEELTFTVKCTDSAYSLWAPRSSHELLENNIGLINPSKLGKGEIHEIMQEFADTDGLIVDLRQYPAENIMYSLASYLVDKYTPFAILSYPSGAVPGTFLKNRIYGSGLTKDWPKSFFYENEVVILMNEQSQSSTEFTIMSLRNGPNVTVMGENSIGSDGDVTFLPLPGGMEMSFTGLGVYTTEGGQTQRIGLSPDIYIERTIAGVREGRDEYIEAAVQYILGKNAEKQ